MCALSAYTSPLLWTGVPAAVSSRGPRTPFSGVRLAASFRGKQEAPAAVSKRIPEAARVPFAALTPVVLAVALGAARCAVLLFAGVVFERVARAFSSSFSEAPSPSKAQQSARPSSAKRALKSSKLPAFFRVATVSAKSSAAGSCGAGRASVARRAVPSSARGASVSAASFFAFFCSFW